ncbi:hypothetical protein EO95_16715 [Methanosarcina sp. 1.H.T.1A.1]|uniref:hypothetical protein n=1 Tax=Methanosarcina sp. 1.H.T.1A.1 TaxID=1483602 RepID=UPI0006219150|nr:hypothetical protein [Methanosarcina sp. 1.H.T.1A.1]KKH93860.1 hypothetical protein EO95_16715 [Methanosarcina sp. 1.H.T.1A.1]
MSCQLLIIGYPYCRKKRSYKEIAKISKKKGEEGKEGKEGEEGEEGKEGEEKGCWEGIRELYMVSWRNQLEPHHP